MNRLKSVANVGESARNNNAHRVFDVGLLHLLDYLSFLDTGSHKTKIPNSKHQITNNIESQIENLLCSVFGICDSEFTTYLPKEAECRNCPESSHLLRIRSYRK